ncbi:response regulator transcription factor [Bacillus sp. DJP31]|uniref:response regulator transcription factor n=1 Tax=Bacillus sp. DJP31 TaxID=3409789 RepID=UPI003BB6BC17
MKSGERCRILIVDDEQLIRQGIKHYLQWEQEGFQIVGEASNGQEALELIELTNPHIVLTDIVMPIMDGEELTRIVKSKYPHIEIIILSSFGEFEYVRSTFQSGAVDYILKPKLDAETLLKVLTTAANRIPSLQSTNEQASLPINMGHIIGQFVSGYDVNYDVDLISRTFPYDAFRLVAVDARHLPIIDAKVIDSLGKRMDTLFDTHLELEDLVLQRFKIEDNVSVFLVNGEADQLAKCYSLAHELIKLDHHLAVLLCDDFLSFSQIGIKYNDVIKKMLEYRFYHPQSKIVTEQNLSIDEPLLASFNLDKFTNDFKHKRFDSAFSYLEDHINALSKSSRMDIFEYKSFFGNVIFNITILLSNLDYDVKKLENERFTLFNSIDLAKTTIDVVEQLHRFIDKAQQIILTRKNHTGHSNFQLMLDYIEENYAKPLNLTGVANHFHFNPSYLSSYFASHNKGGFNEYLNKIRIEEASKLLMNSSIRISEICEMVGYSDHSYFCKVFKKLKGLSPSQYKRKQKLK